MRTFVKVRSFVRSSTNADIDCNSACIYTYAHAHSCIHTYVASLADSDFSGADLRGVRFNDADVSSCDFRGALLHGSDFSNANVTDANFAGLALSECAVPPNVKPSRRAEEFVQYDNDVDSSDPIDKDADDERDGVRLSRQLASAVAPMFGSVGAKLATQPLVICRLPGQ